MLLQLQFAGCAAPSRRIDIRDRLRKLPEATGEILHSILALAIRIVGRRAYDLGAVLDRARAVLIDIADPPRPVPLERQRRRRRSIVRDGWRSASEE
jgi:hypothetical protein